MIEENLFTLITSGGEIGLLGGLVMVLYRRIVGVERHVDMKLNNGIKSELAGIRLDMTEKHADVKAEIAGIHGEMKNLPRRAGDSLG